MSGTEQTTIQYRTLSAIVDNIDRLEAVYKSDLEFGDRLVVTTRNFLLHPCFRARPLYRNWGLVRSPWSVADKYCY